MRLAIRFLCKTIPSALLLISYVGLAFLGLVDFFGDGGLQRGSKQ